MTPSDKTDKTEFPSPNACIAESHSQGELEAKSITKVTRGASSRADQLLLKYKEDLTLLLATVVAAVAAALEKPIEEAEETAQA